MNCRDAYVRFVFADNVSGSNKAGTYVKALDYLSQMMERSALFGSRHFWSIASSEQVQQLYDYALANQKQQYQLCEACHRGYRFDHAKAHEPDHINLQPRDLQSFRERS